MTTGEFLEWLSRLGICVWAEGANVRLNAPKGVLTPALREELTHRKAEILTILRDGGVKRAPERAWLAQVLRQGDLPLSFAQQRLWFLDQLEPNTSAYTITSRQRLRGSLDLTALASAFTELVRRHESLRTTFASKDGEPVQRIADPGPVTFRIVALEHEPTVDRGALVEQMVREEAQRPFDLARGPLFRPILLRLTPDEHELLMAVHHIVADGWSLGILARELGTLYEAFAAGRPSPLPELPIQYADFALWQRRWLTGDIFEAQQYYWREHLGGRPAPLQLPTDHPRSGRPTSAGASHDFRLPRPLADGLRELSRREGATLLMTLLAAFKVLLARYTGQEDIVVGTPVANRNYVELEPVVGFFANMLVLRTDLGGDPTFREILARVRETCLGAYAHPDMPFEKLVEELQPERILGQNPLFQVSLVWDTAVTGADLAFVTVASPFDLTLFVRDGTDRTLSATIQYKRDLFEPETIARLVGHYCTLLEGVVADPDCRLSALPLLSVAEAHRLLIEWNATNMPRAAEETVPRLIEAQAVRTPEAIAVSCEGQSINYRELNRRANRLAHHLRRLGVGPSILVGVCVERSAEMLIAVLAVMKAGGAYVPLDPAYPATRLEFMLQDARSPVLVTQTGLLDRLALPTALHTVCVDRDACHIDAEPESDLEGGASTDDLAYVIYTSGSTGRPKGVQIAQRSLTNLLAAFQATPGIAASDVFVSVTTLSFDIAGLELFLPLVTGAHLVIASREVAADPARLMALMAEAQATVMQATPTTWRMLLEAGWQNAAGLTILCGGEALPSELAARLLDTGASVWNVYGPTETTIWSTIHRVDAADDPVPIGRPIANTRVYVLDRHLRPVPIGVPGELWIAGDGLACGYIDRPELLAERFVVHRLSETLTERLYRSGDRVRWHDDGTLEFLGRLDDQVKVRGYRVELGEIEATLARHPHVREVATVARRTADGERRLIAYIVGNGSVEPRELREFLESRLPDYMIPAAFVALDCLPLTTNGKVDRRALPEPEVSVGMHPSCAEPRDELERQLVKIWQESLAVSSVGIRDNFFDLGGHSLLAVRMFAQIKQIYGQELPLTALFQAPTVAHLADLLRQGGGAVPWTTLVPLHPYGAKPPFFWVHGDASNLTLPPYLGSEQPVYGFLHQSMDGSQARYKRVEDMAAHYLAEIRAVQPAGPYFLGGYSFGGLVAFEIAQQMQRHGQRVALLFLLEPTSPWHMRLSHMPARPYSAELVRHLHALATLGPQARLRYILTRAITRLKDGLHGRVNTMRRLRNRLVYGTALELGYPIPLSLRSFYILDLYWKAVHAYHPHSYPGHMVLVHTTAQSSQAQADWETLGAGGVERHVVPGDHYTVLHEPQLQVWATLLREHLRKRQTAELRTQTQVAS
jgi:amino acid adenylation domain-containing protein